MTTWDRWFILVQVSQPPADLTLGQEPVHQQISTHERDSHLGVINPDGWECQRDVHSRNAVLFLPPSQ